MCSDKSNELQNLGDQKAELEKKITECRSKKEKLHKLRSTIGEPLGAV